MQILNATFIHPSSNTLPFYAKPVSTEVKLFPSKKFLSSFDPPRPHLWLLQTVCPQPYSIWEQFLSWNWRQCSSTNPLSPVLLQLRGNLQQLFIFPNITSNTLAKQFRPIVVTCSVLKLTKRADLSRLNSPFVICNDSLKYALQPNWCTLDTIVLLWHFIFKSLKSIVQSVCCNFLDYLSAFDSFLRLFFLAFRCLTYISLFERLLF